MIFPTPSGFSMSGQSASSVYLGENLVWPDVFLFYAPAIGGGTSGDGVTMGATSATFRNMSGAYFENFNTFIQRRLAQNDRIVRVPYNPCLSKDSYTYNLTFPAPNFDKRTPTRAILAHPASISTITQLKDMDQSVGSPSEIVTLSSAPLISGVSGLLSYNGVNYKLYTLGNLATGSIRNYTIKTCV
jgi:hypothetical protein